MQPTLRARRGVRRGVRRGLLTAAFVASLPLLSGCASNFGSPVFKDYNPVTGINVREDGVWGMNLLVVLPASGGQGTLVGALLNTTRADDHLVGASVTLGPDDDADIASELVQPSVTLTPQKLVELSDPQTVVVEGDVEAGRFVDLTLQFQRSEPIEVEVPVLEPEGPYADVPLQPESNPTSTEAESTGDDGARSSNGGQQDDTSPGPSPKRRG